MSKHILDRPVWSALTTRQAEFAIGKGLARRFHPDISPLTNAKDDSEAALADLAALIPSQGAILVVQADPVVVPKGIQEVSTATCVQMIAEKLQYSPTNIGRRIEPLGESD